MTLNIKEVIGEKDIIVREAVGDYYEEKPELFEGVEIPACYSLHDPVDPSCKRCPVRVGCKQIWMERLPICYKHWLNTDEECNLCMVSPFCYFKTPKVM